MAAFGDQSQHDVADYHALLGSVDWPTIPAWDPFSGQNKLARHNPIHPATLDVGQCAAPPEEYQCDWQTLGDGNDRALFDEFQSREISQEDLSPSCTAFSEGISTQLSQSMPASSYTTASPLSCLASPSAYSGLTANSTNDCAQSHPGFDDFSCAAAQEDAQEDRRQRNTAASARFRIKKRIRGQALENSVKKEQDKITHLEAKIVQLEVENKWLKDLVMEKIEKRSDGEAGSKEDIEVGDD